ncbi:MAG: hypothetical protein HZA27_01150 [Candidatus Omnitrophica bacterium]|nr:hypothetical protein [Candidatus Omnitrophota bacterium]MBI5144774.1 hypothetical protein [Candidatus Omnitrophota bacterium]
MVIIKEKIPIAQLQKIAQDTFGNLVKAVVDVKKEMMVVGGELHSDEEALLLENGSSQKDLWGINLYTDSKTDEWIEFDSMINLKPSQNNYSRGIEDSKIREQVVSIINKLIQK